MSSEREGYARPEMLVETGWLQDHLLEDGIRIVDCDPHAAYRRVHVPGAVGVRDNYFKNPDDRTFVMNEDQIKVEMSSLGIGDDTAVIAYDGFGSLYATRLWWVLSYYGHGSVRVLNGGWSKWFAERRPMTNTRPEIERGEFTPRPDSSILATAEQMKEDVDKTDAVFLDVRSIEEFTGENDRGNARAGHLPGAVHLEWLDYVTPDAVQTFKPAAELRSMFEGAGVTPGKRVSTY
jgi:thiosulfate/3-mercaptopyruvate sulfurtransferase